MSEAVLILPAEYQLPAEAGQEWEPGGEPRQKAGQVSPVEEANSAERPAGLLYVY